MPQHIVIVEDEPVIAANYREALERAGYRVTVYPDRPQAAAGLRDTLPDLAIIDVGLGEELEGGFELCHELRGRAPELPIILLTARDTDADIISGLRLGADDYLSKAISQAHLMARINALLRRVRALRDPEQQEDMIRCGPLMLNRERMTSLWSEQEVSLTVTEFWMVYALARHPGHVKNRQQLMDAADVVLDDSSITSHIKRIRRKFQAVDPGFDALETAYGIGYRWRGQ